MKLKMKLLAGFMSCSLLLFIVGVVGYIGISMVNSNLEEISDNRLPSIYSLEIINEAQTAVKAANRTLMIPSVPDDLIERQHIAIKKAFERVDKARKVYDPLPQTKEEEVLWKQFVPQWDAWKKDAFKSRDMSNEYRKTGDKQVYDSMVQFNMTTAATSFAAAEETLGKIIDLNDKVAQEERVNAQKTCNMVKISIVGSIVVGLLAAVSIAIFLTRGITRQLGGDPSEVEAIATTVSNGDLSIVVNCHRNDKTSVMFAMRTMVDNLRQLVSQAVDISSIIASASHQLHSTADQIATGAEEVSAQIQTVATASEEMSATSTDIAHNCSMAADASRLTTDSAIDGARVVSETIHGMNMIADRVRQTSTTVASLGKRSEQIGDIVGTIEDIADQTNLLALNAAIEAARAGEQGRGFAVVADEVRALAERTTRATREIGEMIKAIQNETKAAVHAMEEGVAEVEKGAVSSHKSGQALEEILERINVVTMQINQIATAAEEQTSTTAEVSGNIHQVTEIVQQSARGAEETASAASQLAGQAQKLQNLVSKFRV